ncbi:MAG: hypothetical protein ABIQ88_09965 [Chitinophagaceae bacterium]
MDILPGINVKNLRTSTYNTSDMGGNYKMAAAAGDSLLFSCAGYHTDTLVINNAMLVREYDVYLAPNIVALPAVQIDALNKYEADSLRRKEEYAFILDKKHPVKLWNEKRASDPPGLSFSPVGYFSKNEKQKRKLKQRLKAEEERDRQAHIDSRFSQARVAQLTRLSGDSLHQFMALYRPDFTFCRYVSSQDMVLYINDKLLLFTTGRNKKKIRS